MMGIYGFTHSLISPCPTNDELLYRTKVLEQKLHDAYTDMKMLEDDLEYVEKILDDCDCCDTVTKSGMERDPMISTMALHEDKPNGNNPHLRHLDDNTATAATSPTRTDNKKGVVNGNDPPDEDQNHHLLVRRTRRWASQMTEF
jgi:hypothetical protein